MNPDFPPVQFGEPHVRSRRRERSGFGEPLLIPADERREISRRLHAQTAAIDKALRERSAEERRALFLKLKHDRPITKADLQGTGITLMSTGGVEESLVIMRKEDLRKLDERLTSFSEGDQPARPRGSEFATTVRSIEIGDPKDRLSQEFLDNFDSLVAAKHNIYEIEIASFALQLKTREKEVPEIVREINDFLGRGMHGQIYETDLASDGGKIVLWSTGAKLRELVENSRWWRKIVFFDLRPKFETFSQVFENFNIAKVRVLGPEADAESICVIDTGVAGGNPFLEKVLQRDLSHSFVNGFSATEDFNGHGSGVASLAAFYQIDISDGAENKASAFVVSARITADNGQLDVPQVEDQEEDRTRQARLLSVLLGEIVEHYKPLGIRIFVLSFQIVGHIWSQATRRLVARNAWVARALDRLSREHDIVFVTITGNLTSSEVSELQSEESFPKYLLRPLAKLLDPGQAAIAVTAGSIAHSSRIVVSPHSAIAQTSQPSPFTRSGPGFGNSTKPDFVERGGNLVRDIESAAVSANAGTNVIMASGRLTPVLQHSHGTSFAAPRVAHHLAGIRRDLRRIGIDAGACLLRAFLAVSAEQPQEAAILDLSENLAILGYGLPDQSRATDCSASSITMFWQGTISANTTAIFRIPVPSELVGSGRGLKRIIVAIATAPPVQQWGVAEYLGVETKFWLFRGDESFEKIEALMQRDEEERNIAAKDGVDHLPGTLGITRRSAGTLQRDEFSWQVHKDDFSASDYTLAVAFKSASWCTDNPTIPVAIVVRLEDTTGKCEAVYVRAQARIQAQVRARA